MREIPSLEVDRNKPDYASMNRSEIIDYFNRLRKDKHIEVIGTFHGTYQEAVKEAERINALRGQNE